MPGWEINYLGQRKPECRFGQTQVVLNNKKILILGGSGGTHIDYSDAWILDMSNENIWKWVPVEIKAKANKPKNIWSNPGCKVKLQCFVRFCHG